MSLLRITNVRTGPERQPVDLVIERGQVAAVVPSDAPIPARAQLLDGDSGIVLPGFADDHVHLGAWLRSRRSVEITAGDEFHDVVEKLHLAPPRRGGWRVCFGVDHHQDWGLQAVTMLERPALLVHRTGRAAYVNRSGAGLLGMEEKPTILYDRGVWSRVLGPAEAEEEARLLVDLRVDLLSQGVVAIRDATPYPCGAEERLAELRQELSPIRVMFMGDPQRPVDGAEHVKVLAPLSAGNETLAPLPRAVHAIEPHEAVAACDLIGDRPGRVEHAALCPPSLAELLAGKSVKVCANPSFLVERAQALESWRVGRLDELLHPVGLLNAYGVPYTFGSDAPVTTPGVLGGLVAARTRGGPRVPFNGQSISAKSALAAVATSSDLVDAPAQHWIGRPADLAVWPERLFTEEAFDRTAMATVVAGKLVWTSKT